jgi:hypothetical protein
MKTKKVSEDTGKGRLGYGAGLGGYLCELSGMECWRNKMELLYYLRGLFM